MPGFDVSQFVKTVLQKDLKKMVHCCELHYLAFGQIAVGIEFLGACRDSHDFGQQGHSGCRFERGITDYMARIDSRYAQFNNSASPYYLYKQLRCGMSHLLRPQGKVAVTTRAEALVDGRAHLTVDTALDKLVFVSEQFYDDFYAACDLLLADLPTLTHVKLQGTYLTIT